MTDAGYFERFKAKTVVSEHGCWLWQGYVHEHTGYGEASYRCQNMRIHRAMWIVARGPIPERLHVCHSCDTRNCVNPDHLWLGTNKQNHDDCKAKGRTSKGHETHCKRGHPFTAENIQLRKATSYRAAARRCVICDRASHRISKGWPAGIAYLLPAGMSPF